jgi:hypothetical protein
MFSRTHDEFGLWFNQRLADATGLDVNTTAGPAARAAVQLPDDEQTPLLAPAEPRRQGRPGPGAASGLDSQPDRLRTAQEPGTSSAVSPPVWVEMTAVSLAESSAAELGRA